MRGRPGFEDLNEEGPAPPYFMYHTLPFEAAGDRVVFQPHYLTGLSDDGPTFGPDQSEAVPLYTDEFEPVNHAAVSWIAPLRRWLMIYGGAIQFADNQQPSCRRKPASRLYACRVASGFPLSRE